MIRHQPWRLFHESAIWTESDWSDLKLIICSLMQQKITQLSDVNAIFSSDQKDDENQAEFLSELRKTARLADQIQNTWWEHAQSDLGENCIRTDCFKSDPSAQVLLIKITKQFSIFVYRCRWLPRNFRGCGLTQKFNRSLCQILHLLMPSSGEFDRNIQATNIKLVNKEAPLSVSSLKITKLTGLYFLACSSRVFFLECFCLKPMFEVCWAFTSVHIHLYHLFDFKNSLSTLALTRHKILQVWWVLAELNCTLFDVVTHSTKLC